MLNMLAENPPLDSVDNETVVVQRRIPAKREFLFACFTDPDLLRKWWIGREDNSVAASMDVRVGGEYRVSYTTREGQVRVTTGKYVEVDKPDKLSFTWKWGEFDSNAEETLVCVQFLPDKAETRLILTHGRFPDTSLKKAHLDGWLASLGMLGKKIAECSF